MEGLSGPMPVPLQGDDLVRAHMTYWVKASIYYWFCMPDSGLSPLKGTPATKEKTFHGLAHRMSHNEVYSYLLIKYSLKSESFYSILCTLH